MKAVHIKETNVILAKDQPEYQQLPAQYNDELPEKPFTFCYELDAGELATIAQTGKIWIRQLTFGKPFQPIQAMVYNPFAVVELQYYKAPHGTYTGRVPLTDGTFDEVPGVNIGNMIDNIREKYLTFSAENFALVLIDYPNMGIV